MGARTQLNSFYTFSCVGLAVLAGLLSGSATVFWAALALALAASLHGGSIRPKPVPRRQPPRRRHPR
jgi:hypothetical protein